MKRNRVLRGLIRLAIVLVMLAGPLAVVADYLVITEIDDVVVVGIPQLDLGEIMLGESAEGDVTLAIERSREGETDENGDDVTFANGGEIFISAQTSSAAVSAVMSDNRIYIFPTRGSEGVNWSESEDGVLTSLYDDGTASSTVTVDTKDLATGVYTATVTYQAVGYQQAAGGDSRPLTRTVDLPVTWTVVSDAATCYAIELLPPVTLDKPFNRNSTLPVKLQVWDDGENVSDMDVVVAVAGLTKTSNGTGDAEAVSAGNANPDSNFRYDADLEGYIFNLSLKGLTSGTWVLNFTVDGDACGNYMVTFQVK